MSTHVFTYGSLMFDAVWTRVVEGRYRTVAGVLHDHARFAVTGQDYPGTVPSAGATVDGVAYLDVAPDDLVSLDDFEGADYRRDVVAIVCADGVVRDCATYLYLPVDRLAAAAWDPAAFALDRFLATYCRDWPPP